MANSELIELPSADGGTFMRHESTYVDKGALVGLWNPHLAFFRISWQAQR